MQEGQIGEQQQPQETPTENPEMEDQPAEDKSEKTLTAPQTPPQTTPQNQTQTAAESTPPTNHPQPQSQPPIPTPPPQNSLPAKENIEDEMQKYFQEFGVMESIPSSKRLELTAAKPPTDAKEEGSEDYEESNIDEEELYRYKQLENKLNFALNKIEICKDSSMKSLRMAPENADVMYKRFEYYEKKRKQQIERKKHEREEEVTRELKNKPSINEVSAKLVGKQEPIYERYQRVINQKQKKLEDERLRIKRKEEEEEEEFMKGFEERNRKPNNARSTDDFYNELVRWKEKKEQKNKEKLETQKKQQLSIATFQPQINQKSKRLVAKKPERQPIFTREPKVRPVVQEFTFTPKINKKIASYK